MTTRLLLASGLLSIALGAGAGAETQRAPLQPPAGQRLVLPTLPSDAFFDDSVLQEIRLEINAKDWQTLKDNYLSNEYYPCDFKWNGQVVRNVGIRSRGNFSRSGVKPGLRVDFNRYKAGQSFLDLKSVVLRNNTTDLTGLHERVTMQLFARMGLPAPRVAHARLYINSSFVGLYGVVESLDKSFLSRNFDESDGYLYKYDRNADDAPYYLEYLGPNIDLYVPHPFSPETHENDPQPRPLVDLIRTVAEASDATFRTAIAQYLDIDNFIRHVAVVVFMADEDGILGNWGMNNFDIYQRQNSTLHVLIPWDKSEATRPGPTYSIFHNIDDVPGSQRNRLMERIVGIPELKSLYLDTMLEIADASSELIFGDGRGWLEREVERETLQIQDAVLADPQKTFTNDQFGAAIEDLRTFARERAAFVRDEVASAR